MVKFQLDETIGLTLAIVAVIIGVGIYTDFLGLFTNNNQECQNQFEKLSKVINSIKETNNERINYILTQNENDCILRYYNEGSYVNNPEISNINDCKENNCLILFKKKGTKYVADKIEVLNDINLNTVGDDENKIIDLSNTPIKELTITKTT